MKTDNHYEVAFEAYLRQRGVATLPIVEARRSYLDADSVKSPDFLVVAADEARLVVDVKGRKFGGTADKPRRIWQNWCLRDDVTSLESWTEHFGPGFRGVLAFVYHLGPEIASRSLYPGPVCLSRRALSRPWRRGQRLPRRNANAKPALADRPPPHRRVPRHHQAVLMVLGRPANRIRTAAQG